MNSKTRKLCNEIRLGLAGTLAGALPTSRDIEARKVVFSSFHGTGYGCNPRYIAEALLAMSEQPLDLVWLVRRHDPAMPPQIRQVPWGSLAAAREWATAHVWVDNTHTRRYVAKKPGQFFVQTWHGCLTPKPIEGDIEGILSRTYVKSAKKDGLEADCILCNNDFFEEVIRRSFYFKGRIQRCGLPRNAALIHPRPEVRNRVRRQLGIPDGTRMCLYAPTFRDDGSAGVFPIDHRRCCQVLHERFGAPFAFVLRLHPLKAAASARFAGEGVLDASAMPDAIELLCAADVLITDYSSIAEDFALLGRPGYQYAPDQDSFVHTRGLYYPLDVRPFPLAHTQDELFDAIRHTDDETFRINREAFFEAVGLEDDGRGDQVVARLILDVLDGQAWPHAEKAG